MGGKRLPEIIKEKVRMCIFLTLEEDGVTSSPNVAAYADQLGDSDVTVARAHHELERWFKAGYLTRRQVGDTFYYEYTLEGALEMGERYDRPIR